MQRVCGRQRKSAWQRERGQRKRECVGASNVPVWTGRVCICAHMHGCVCHGCAVSTRGPPNSPLVGGSHTDADILTTDPPAGEKPLTGTLLIYSLQSPIFTSLQLANTLDILFYSFSPVYCIDFIKWRFLEAPLITNIRCLLFFPSPCQHMFHCSAAIHLSHSKLRVN